jgi:release factor glutamine methyltransferase
VSNPPYIPSGEVAGLQPEVRDHDPHDALDGGHDGLAFIRKLLRWGEEALRPGGWVVLEHADGQESRIAELLRAHGLEGIESQPDLAGRPRVIAGRRPHHGS